MNESEQPRVNWDELVKFRRANVTNLMKKKELDAVILTGYDSIRYASNLLVMQQFAEAYFEECAVIVTPNGDCYPIIRLFEHSSDEKILEIGEMPWIKEIISGAPANTPSEVASDIWAKLLSGKLIDLGAQKVGFDLLFSQIHETLRRSTPAIEYTPILTELLELRAVKHQEEIKLLEYSQSVTDAAARVGLELIRNGAGKTEREIAAKMAEKMYELGVEYVTHLMLFSGQPGGTLHPSNRMLREGESMMFDIGCVGIGGYVSDMARTGFVGEPDQKLLDEYANLKTVYLEAIKAVRPGLKASELYRTVERILTEFGYSGPRFSLGHGIGLRMMEFPQIDRPETTYKDMEFKPGMVICIEPNIAPGNIFLGIENEVVITETGSKQLTKTEF
jgi:Xaa-Pro aminopeptidase